MHLAEMAVKDYMITKKKSTFVDVHWDYVSTKEQEISILQMLTWASLLLAPMVV